MAKLEKSLVVLDPNLPLEEHLLLRNRIVISWVILAVAYGIGAIVLLSGWQRASWMLGGLAAMFLARFLRMMGRPPMGNWSIRRHLYMGSYFLPLGAVYFAMDGDAVHPLIQWAVFIVSLLPFWEIQVKDDLAILRAVNAAKASAGGGAGATGGL